MIKYNMISTTILDKLANSFKSFKKTTVTKELQDLPDPTKWLVNELDMYDDIITDYKDVAYSGDITIVEDETDNLAVTGFG